MKNDILRFEETEAGLTVFYRNCYLYSHRTPPTLPRKMVEQANLSPHTLIFIPSFGLGYGLPELLEKLPPHCHILCVEEDELLLTACLEKIGKPKWLRDKRLSLYRSCSKSTISDFFAKQPVSQFRHFLTIILCQAYRLAEEFYQQLAEGLENEIRHYWQNKLTLIYLGQRYVCNIFANLPLLARASDLSELIISRPLLVCGAGPGLEKSIHLIKVFRKSIYLFAVDTALPVLTAAGLVPDLVFVLEPQWHNLADFLSTSNLDFKLVADLASAPQVLRLGVYRKNLKPYLFSSEFARLSLFARLRQAGLLPFSLPPLGSVGVAAVYASRQLYQGPIFLAGLDFSYPSKLSHARGSAFHISELKAGSRFCPVGQNLFRYLLKRELRKTRDKQGQPLLTDVVLAGYAENLRAFCAKDKLIFDLNPSGLALTPQLLSSAQELEERLTQAKEISATTTEARPTPLDPDVSLRLKSFLQNERELLKEASLIITSFISKQRLAEIGQTPLELPPELRNSLSAVDYCICHLPFDLACGKLSLSEVAHASYFISLFNNKIEELLARLSKSD